MRTTVDLDDDTAAAVDRLRRERRMGLSEVVNELLRRGLADRPEPTRFVQETAALGLQLDVTSVADALEVLEGPDAR